MYTNCKQCPRHCGVNREEKVGFCKEPAALRIASAGLHFGEEPLITVKGGSGTIFVTGCTLRCAFCQNYQISQNGMGREINSEEFTKICLDLQNMGAENINIITGSHHIPLLAQYIRHAKEAGCTIPFCWNSSAYESVEMLELLKGLVTIWLPDLKTLDSDLSAKLFKAPDYPEVAKKAITWMMENNPVRIEEVSRNGETFEKMTSGVIIRHLFLPGKFQQTCDTLSWLSENADGSAVISLMNQYTPVPFEEDAKCLEERKKSLSEIENRLTSKIEDEDIRDMLEVYDFEYLFYQELSDDTSWLPDFRNFQPFPNKLAKPIWHWNSKIEN